MGEVIITKPKVLSAADKAALRKSGIVVVEAAEPSEVRFIRATTEIPSSQLLFAAMSGLRKAGSSSGNETFVRLIQEYVQQALPDDDAPQPADGGA